LHIAIPNSKNKKPHPRGDYFSMIAFLPIFQTPFSRNAEIVWRRAALARNSLYYVKTP